MKKSAIHFHELNEQQKRQLIDAEMLFSALEQAEMETIRHRGSMFWREQDGGAISSLFRPIHASARSGLRPLKTN